jgi:hypothetical protein
VTEVGGIAAEDLPLRAVEFLDTAVSRAGTSSIRGRGRPLFALPLVGTGAGGWSREKGGVTRRLISSLSEWVAVNAADVVLVCWSDQAFAAAQAERRRLRAENSLPDALKTAASGLGRAAALGRLVLFLGAGLGIPAGLPRWNELISELAGETGLSLDEQVALSKLSPIDAARIIEARLLEQGRQLGVAVRGHVQAERFALAHALLASLPINESVTTNYDTLYERATAAAGRRVAVLPYEVPRTDGWLLKLHGCVDRGVADIVLTRGDYLRYADRRAALAGIVQALLITREMMFVGFSLTDDNFHRIADDVRKAVREPQQGWNDPFGTALVLEDEPLMRELWANDVTCLAVGDAASPIGGQQLDLFLDATVSAASTGARHLLDPEFEGALDEGERTLSTALQAFLADLPPIARQTAAWAVVIRSLEDLGLRKTDS